MTASAQFDKDTQLRMHRLCGLRSLLEAFAVKTWRNSARRDDTLQALRVLLNELKALASRGNYEAFHKTDMQFHRVAVAAANLEALTQSWELVAAAVYEWTLSVKRNFWPNLMALHREHVLLLEAWQTGDESVVEQATHLHLEAGFSRSKMAAQQGGVDLSPLERAVSYLASHYARALDMAWLARQVSFVSASQLNRLFRTKYGCTPARYLKQMRLERAAQLLHSSAEPVARIARQVGYRNSSHFVRDFRRLLRVTPLQYRKKKR
jgi:AraC-like DNA-binding protein